MTLRILKARSLKLAHCLLLLAALTSSVMAQQDRAADRTAIQAHIDSIFQAFIKKDVAALRATHAENWLGYLDNSGRMLKGISDYMDWNQLDPKSPYGMKSYKFRDFDMIFKGGDAAFVCFVADVESNWPGAPPHRVLQICDFYTKNDGKWIQSGSYTGPQQETVEEQLASPRSLGDQMKQRLLDAREAVWRAYFAGDRATLEKLIPSETIAIESGDNNWSNRQKILDGSVEFAKSGGKLIKLEFPKTEIQVYGATAVIYSNYSYELEIGGKRSTQAGRVTEVFVLRKGQWVNPGWHMDSGK
jgi:ketosteroid isomerase-like protein